MEKKKGEKNDNITRCLTCASDRQGKDDALYKTKSLNRSKTLFPHIFKIEDTNYETLTQNIEFDFGHELRIRALRTR